MSVFDYEGLKAHIGHKLECVQYGNGENVAIECLDCNEVLLDYDRGESAFTNTIRADIQSIVEGCGLGVTLTPEQMDEIVQAVKDFDDTDYNEFVLDKIRKVTGIEE